MLSVEHVIQLFTKVLFSVLQHFRFIRTGQGGEEEAAVCKCFSRTTQFTSHFSGLLKCNLPMSTQLSNHLFEELAMDVYDEVDRRETDAGRLKRSLLNSCSLQHGLVSFWLFFTVWLATQNHSTLVTETTVVPFLPVNPEYSSTRNQARQLYSTSLHRVRVWPQLTLCPFPCLGTAETGEI